MKLGVIGTANIALHALIPALDGSDHEVLAIASRDEERAQDAATEYSIPRAYGSYEELLEDDELDAVYNPLPNALHAEWTKRAADHGLHVLCEKPLGVDEQQARAMGEYCADRDVTLMEAFMYRYHPRTERAAAIVADELDGVRSVKARFTFPLRRDHDIRLDPDLAGGSLMDVGCYAVTAARLFLGEPERVYATATDSRGCGVDTQLAGVLEYEDGATAEIACGFDTPDGQHYRVEATNGWLEVEEAFVPRGDGPATLRYAVDGRTVTESFDPTDQYRLEVEHFADCIGRGERPRTDATEAARTMAVIDALTESARLNGPVPLE